MGGFDSMEGLIQWIKSQPDESSFHDIKKLLTEKLVSNDSLDDGSILENAESRLSNINLKELSDKNEELSVTLCKIERELKNKSEGLDLLKIKLEKMQDLLAETENALLEEKTVNEALMNRINEVQAADSVQTSRNIIELQNELESKELEALILKTENAQLQSSVEYHKRSSAVYVNTIEELSRKLQSLRLSTCEKENCQSPNSRCEELTSLEYIESLSERNAVSVHTQTFWQSDEGNNADVYMEKKVKWEVGECFLYVTCMAHAVEEMLAMINN